MIKDSGMERGLGIVEAYTTEQASQKALEWCKKHTVCKGVDL